LVAFYFVQYIDSFGYPRPVKQAVSWRLDADGVAWLKKPGQTRANHILREHMLTELRGKEKSA
jgi:uncharacterized protein (DUF4415 family)